jgi:hypothetical protein
MRDIAALLERKRALLDLRQKAEAEQLAKIEHDLREIDKTLTCLESKEAPSTAPR